MGVVVRAQEVQEQRGPALSASVERGRRGRGGFRGRRVQRCPFRCRWEGH